MGRITNATQIYTVPLGQEQKRNDKNELWNVFLACARYGRDLHRTNTSQRRAASRGCSGPQQGRLCQDPTLVS